MKNKKLLVAVLSISFVLSSQTAKADADSSAKTELTDVAENNQASSTSDSPISENSTNKEGGENDGEAIGDDNKTKPEEDNEQEEKDQLVIKTLKVKLGESVDPSLAIENLPKGARVVYEGEKIDTSKAGTRHIDLTIKHDDKSKKDYKLTVELVVEDNKEDTKENSGEDDKNTQKTEKENKSLVNDAQSQNPGLQVADIKMSERVRSSAMINQIVHLDLTLTGINGSNFDVNLLPESFNVDVQFNGASSKTYKKNIKINRSDIVGNKVRVTAVVEIPDPLGSGNWDAIIENAPETIAEGGSSSARSSIVDKSISFEKEYFQIINPEIKVKVQDPYKREVQGADVGTITGKLTIDNEFEGKVDLGFSIGNGNSTDITESEDFVENHDLTELNKPGNPQLTVDNIINGEIKLGKSTYKIQSTYNNKTGGLITLTTTPDVLDPNKDGKTYDTPEGYVRVTFEAGEGVEHFDPVIKDIKKGAKLPESAFPNLPNPLIGYENPTWSIPAGTDISEGKIIKANATKIADILPGTKPQPNGYVSVTFQPGDHGTIASTETTKYWVNPGAGKKLSDVTKPEVKAADGYKFTVWDKEDTTSITAALEVTAQYKKKVVTENPNDTDYAKVAFVTDKGTVTGTKEYWVLKGEKVEFTAPTVDLTGVEGYTFKAWNPVVAESYSVDTTHNATFTYTGKDIVPQKPGENKPELPENFVLVEFKAGSHGTIAADQTVIYWVNPEKSVTLTAPTVTANAGWVQKTGEEAWDKPLTGKFATATDITAQYQENDSHKYEPKGQNIRVKKGDNPKAEDGISNKDKLPESTKYDWKKQPDTSTDNTKDATVVVTYPDGSKDEVKVKVIVTIDGSIIRPIPKLESIPEKVDFGGDYNLTDNIKNLPEGASVVDVTPEGVIDVNKTGEYTGKVKVNFKDGSSRVVDVEVIVGKSQADRLTPIIPAEKTGVKNLENLTDKEKEKVKGKIDEANKGNFPDGTKVDVDNNGKATITYPDKSKDIIQATDLVFQYEHGEPAIEEKPEMTIADIIDPSIPEKTEVTDKDKLTDDEKEEVKGKIEEANKDKFPEGTKVVVGKDGGASITYPDGSVDTIQGSDLVIEKTVDNGGNLPGGDDHKTGGDDYKPGDKQTDAEKNPAQKPNKTEVDNPNDLTEEEKDKVKKEVKKVNPKAKDVDVDNKGNATLTYPDGSKNHIPASDTVVEKKKVKPQTKTDAENNPAIIPSDKTGVVDKNNLTDEERREVADKLMKANPKAVDVIVDAQGNARLKYADGSSNHIAASELVFEKAKGGKTVKVPSDSKQANKNVKTGVESLTGVMATLVAAVGGLFASKRKKDEDR